MTQGGDNYHTVGRIRTATMQVTETRMKSAVKTKALKINKHVSFGQSLLQNDMEVEATGSPMVCMLGLQQVCIKFSKYVICLDPKFMLDLNFGQTLCLVWTVCTMFAVTALLCICLHQTYRISPERCKPTANFDHANLVQTLDKLSLFVFNQFSRSKP